MSFANSASANTVLNAAIAEQLDGCRSALSAAEQPAAARVHDVRKCIKRLRALLALRGRQKHLKRELRALRLVAHSLGRVRDAAAIAHTWSEGAERVPEPARSLIAAVLSQNQARLSPPEREARRLARAEQIFRALRVRLVRTLGREPSQSAKPLERAAGASYDRARRALRRVVQDRNVESLHTLRRAAKRHQYQLQFLEPLWQRPLEAQRKEIARLTELLGTHRDLSAIEELIERDRPEPLHAIDDAWREELRRWQAELLGSALGLAHVALSETTRGFEKRLHRLFAAQSKRS